MTPAAFLPVHSTAVPLLADNIDTDVITPIGRVLQGREATIAFAFEPLRFGPDGALRADCPLNDPAYAGAEILIAGANFACGSSRETAVWAVAGMGFRVVIAPSFGDIFHTNCFKNGVLPIVLAAGEVAALARHASAGGAIQIDLEAGTVTAANVRYSFETAPLRKEALLLGLDDLGLILRRSEAVARFEEDDRRRRPWIYALDG
jgi:3-isopropylmalate/(R)-2-methylmalate dehydratase small subunit